MIGAGIAGTALAYALSHSGRQVLLLERDLSEPDRIVGELLQPGGVNALSKIGLEGVLEGIDATPVEGYTITTGLGGESKVGCPYPALSAMIGEGDAEVRLEHEVQRNLPDTKKDSGIDGKSNGRGELTGHANGYANGHADGHLRNRHSNGNGNINGHANGAAEPATSILARWHVESSSGRKEGRSFHHGRLIQSLRRRCIDDAPNLTVLQATVRDLIYCDDSNHVIGVNAAFKVRLPTHGPEDEPETVVKKIYAPLTIIADGYASKFRSVPGSRVPPSKTRSSFVGVILHDIDLPVPRTGTVCLTPSGPVLLYQIGLDARETRMLVDIKGKLPNQANGSLRVSTKRHSPPIVFERLRWCTVWELMRLGRALSSTTTSHISPQTFIRLSSPHYPPSVFERCPIPSFRPQCKVSQIIH